MMQPPRFLSIDDILVLHAIAIKDQGGDATLRDRGLLESAVAMPAQQYAGSFLHEDIPAMASAYAFHICKNHPFVDGNKRAATAAMIAFLADNGWSFDADLNDAEMEILRLAAGEADKAEFTQWARQQMREKPKMELREFFQRLTWEQVREMSASVVAAGSENEAKATSREAALSIPIIAILEELAQANKSSADEIAYSYFNSMSVLLTAMFRIAEDMGYEW